MSYDVTVWSTDPAVLPACLPRASAWHGEGGTWVWWAGIPRGPVHAAVVGEPYLALWPGLIDQLQIDQALGFVSTDDWTQSEDAFQRIGEAPAYIAQHAPEFRS